MKSRSAKEGGNRPVKLGIVGVGRGGQAQLRELAGREALFEVTAVYDALAERAEAAAVERGARAFSDLERFLEEGDMELVTLANRTTDHVAAAMACLKAGKRVLVEKPIAATHRGAKRLADYAKRRGGQLYVRHNRRFERGFCAVQSAIKSGSLGEVFDIKLRRGGYQRRDDWQTLREYGGGQGLNWGPHLIDHALVLLQGQPYELWSDLKQVAARGDAEDHFKALFRGKRTGLIVDVEITGAQALPDCPYRVTGSRGALRGSDKELVLRYIDPKQRFRPSRARAGTPDLATGYKFGEPIRWVDERVEPEPPPRDLWDCLYDTIRKRRKFPITMEHALEVMKAIDAAKRGTRFESPLSGR